MTDEQTDNIIIMPIAEHYCVYNRLKMKCVICRPRCSVYTKCCVSFTNVVCACVRFAEYDNDIYSDDDMMVDIDDSADSQLSEVAPQLNHVNGDIENDLDSDLDASKAVKQHMLVVGTNTVRRQSSVGAVNGLKTHEHNIILQRMATVEVKKPGRGNMFC